jgi:hypothetical protein
MFVGMTQDRVFYNGHWHTFLHSPKFKWFWWRCEYEDQNWLTVREREVDISILKEYVDAYNNAAGEDSYAGMSLAEFITHMVGDE